PTPVAPLDGDTITYPTPVVLKWDVFDGASKYKVKYGDDLNTLSAVTPIETAATSFSPTSWLKPGLHYWSVASVDAKGHISGYSDPLSFTWVWPSAVTGLTVTD